MPAGTPIRSACVHQLEHAIGAVAEEPVREGIADFTPYRITDRGFAFLRKLDYLPKRFITALEASCLCYPNCLED